MRQLHPRMESLEGRSLPSTTVVKIPPPIPAQENIHLQAPPLVSQQSPTMTLLISRSNLTGTVLNDTLTVQVATGPAVPTVLTNGRRIPPAYPLATAGVQYQPINQTVTFPPGVMSQTITIPIVDGAPNPGRVLFDVTAMSVNSAGLETTPAVTTTVTLANDTNATLPEIIGSHLVKHAKKVVGIAIRFNQPMDMASVQNVRAYTLTDITNHQQPLPGVFGLLFPAGKNTAKTMVPIKKVVYDPSMNQVILYTRKNLSARDEYRIENTNARLNPIRNSLGILLDDNGTRNRAGQFLFTVTNAGSSI